MGGGRDMETSLSFKGQLISTTHRPFATSRFGVGAVLVGTECFVFGGFAGSGPKHYLHKFDVVKNTWTNVLPRNDHTTFGSIRVTFVMNDVLYALTWNQPTQKHYLMSLDLILPEEWVPAGKTPCPRTGFGAIGTFVEVRNESVVFGGLHGGTNTFVYSVDKSSWYSPKVAGKPPCSRRNHAMCSAGHNVFLLGGQMLTDAGSAQSMGFDLHILRMVGTRFEWSNPVPTGPAPPKRYLFPAVYMADRIFVYGGCNGYTCLNIYSIKENRWYNWDAAVPERGRGMVTFTTELRSGNAVHAAIATNGRLLAFGGDRMDANMVMEITPN